MIAWWHCWGCRPPLTASHIHIGCMESVWAPSYAVDRHMDAPLHSYTGKVGPDFGNLGQRGYYEMMAWWHCWGWKSPLTASHIHIGCMEMFRAPSYAVDRHMDAPLHCYTGKVCPDVGNLGKHGYYEMMAWWHGWCFRPPLFASHIHIGYTESVWAPSYAVDRHMDAPLYCYTGKVDPDFGNLGQRGYYEMMAWWYYWGCRPPLTASLIHIEYIKSVWAPSYAADKHMDAPLHCYTGKVGPDFGNLDQYAYSEMMAWWHCWGRRPPLFASHIHIDFIRKVFEHHFMLWIDILMNPYTITLAELALILVIWACVAALKWWYDDIVDAVYHHWLLPTSILNIKIEFEHHLCCG